MALDLHRELDATQITMNELPDEVRCNHDHQVVLPRGVGCAVWCPESPHITFRTPITFRDLEMFVPVKCF